MCTHKWTKEEEQCLLDLVEKDTKNQQFGNAYFYRHLADELNTIFGKKPGYVKLTGEKVKYKIRGLRSKG